MNNTDTTQAANPLDGITAAIDERSYNINGYETDHSGAPYDAQDALDFIFKWYGTCTRHTITRP